MRRASAYGRRARRHASTPASNVRPRIPVAALGGALLVLLGGCAAPAPNLPRPAPDGDGPSFPFVELGPTGVATVDGDDWSLPGWVLPAANSGFFSEDASTADRVLVRSVDVTWRQIRPTRDGGIDRASTDEAQDMSFAGLDDQLDEPGAYWMRIFASGEDWAPEWVIEDCDISTYGPDYDGEQHLPIWDECVWGHLVDTYRVLFADAGLSSDPRLKFVYVPGAFTWAEFDYDLITEAVDAGDLDWDAYADWYSHAWTDLTGIFGAASGKLVFTGEDYPFGPFGERDDLLAAEAVAAGLGIRNGITEISNFHLSEAPAFGSSILPNGHLVVDESLPIHDGTRIVATENECFTDCGYGADLDDPYYAVRQANLKSLQLRMNWMYVVPEDSYFAEFPELWDWVRLSLGQTGGTSADAWAALRDAEDTYWANNEPGRFADDSAWVTRPYVRNLERWLVQVDVDGSVAHRTAVNLHRQAVHPDNGDAYEGLSTSVADGDTGFAFQLDDRFAAESGLLVKVTFLDEGDGSFTVDTATGSSAAVERTGSGRWRTATVALPSIAAQPGWDLRVAPAQGADDLVVRFVRVIRTAAP